MHILNTGVLEFKKKIRRQKVKDVGIINGLGFSSHLLVAHCQKVTDIPIELSRPPQLRLCSVEWWDD